MLMRWFVYRHYYVRVVSESIYWEIVGISGVPGWVRQAKFYRVTSALNHFSQKPLSRGDYSFFGGGTIGGGK